MATIPSGYRHLEKSERRAAPGSHRIELADPQEIVSVTIRVRRRPDAPPLPDPSSLVKLPAGQTKFLSREDFAARYGAARNDLDDVANFARGHGLSVIESSVPRRTVVVSGSVKQMNLAFAVELGHYESPTEKYRGREGYVHLPHNLADIVEGVFGLDNRRMARPLLGRKSPATAQSGIEAGAITPVTPPQVAKLYNFPAQSNAAGQTIGLLEFGGGFTLDDIQKYFVGPISPIGTGFTTPTVVAVPIDGATNAPDSSNESAEVALDVEVAGSVAQGAKIAVYFAPWTEQGWVDAVTTAVHDATNKPSVLSISWGWAELEQLAGLLWSPAAMYAVGTTFQEAAAMGVTVFAASGDNGSNCQIGDTRAHVLYPASDPWLTACGGTSIENVAGSSFTEATWNDNGITGGGISDVFNPQPWQNSANVPSSKNPPGDRRGRGVPDVAGHANGYVIVFAGESQGSWFGTSEVAPLYAGLVALLNAARGEPLGYLNTILYAEGGTSVFRDIADGGSNAAGGAPGYISGPGWDACTGLGSINGNAFLSARPLPSIEATITRTDPGGDIPGSRLPVTLDFEVSGSWFTPGGAVGGLPEPVVADDGGSFSWSARLRPGAQFPGFRATVGELFSVTDVAEGATVSAVVGEIEG
jgi:kumamolisin